MTTSTSSGGGQVFNALSPQDRSLSAPRSRAGCSAEERTLLIRWLSEGNYTNAITLNSNRYITIENLEKLFGRFCKMVDQYYLKATHVERLRSCLRFQAIAFVEHPNSCPHLHIAAELSENWLRRRLDESDHLAIDRFWRHVTNGAGSSLLKSADIAGWGRYITKDFPAGGRFLLSSDFHPNDAVVQSDVLKSVLDQISGIRSRH